MFDIVPLTKEQLGAGRVRALAITAAQREPAVPNVPTFAELGMPGIEGGPWFGLFAPAGTPRAAIDWVNAEANKAFSSPDLKARLEGQGLTLPLGTPEAFGKHVTAETARWGEVIRKGNIKAE
jgi:tripartite-type tricarboxylate transporter receptor subunit TctC